MFLTPFPSSCSLDGCISPTPVCSHPCFWFPTCSSSDLILEHTISLLFQLTFLFCFVPLFSSPFSPTVLLTPCLESYPPPFLTCWWEWCYCSLTAPDFMTFGLCRVLRRKFLLPALVLQSEMQSLKVVLGVRAGFEECPSGSSAGLRSVESPGLSASRDFG